MLTDEIIQARQLFMPIALLDVQQLNNPKVSIYDICKILNHLWQDIKSEFKDADLFDPRIIMLINQRIAKHYQCDIRPFQSLENWQVLVDMYYENQEDYDEDMTYLINWIFSSLYWENLSQCRLSTAWFVMNLFRLRDDKAEIYLDMQKIPEFLDTLSGSAPPISDGTCFNPARYAQRT